MKYVIVPKSTIFVCTWSFAALMIIGFIESAVTSQPFISALYAGCAVLWTWIPFNIVKKGKIDKIVRIKAAPDE